MGCSLFNLCFLLFLLFIFFGFCGAFFYLLVCFFLVVLTTAFDFLASSTFAFFICAFAVFTEVVFVDASFSFSPVSFLEADGVLSVASFCAS